jgi:hypothetical protein
MIEKTNLNQDEIIENYEEFLKFVGETFTGERKKHLLKMYSPEELGEELSVAPASMSEHFHYAFPGGYILHIMRVIKASFGSKKLFEAMGAEIDFTDEEMIFAAMHHDLGKLGDKKMGSYYVPQDNDWKLKQGEQYRLNPNQQYMEVSDRAIFVLQQYGVTVTWKEYLGIKLADGMYKEAAKTYLVHFKPEMFLKTTLPRVIHVADYICARGEYDQVQIKGQQKLS